MKDRKLEDLMTSRVITVHPKDKISKAEELLDRYRIHHLPVCTGDKVVGIVSQGDLMAYGKRFLAHQDKFPSASDFSLNNIEEIMTPNPISLDIEDGLESALILMVEKRINCVPVLQEGRLIGILTSYDVIEDYLKCNK